MMFWNKGVIMEENLGSSMTLSGWGGVRWGWWWNITYTSKSVIK